MILEVFTRVFVDADALDTTCAFYQDLLGGEQSLRYIPRWGRSSPRSPHPGCPS
jgi:hypothetical protein